MLRKHRNPKSKKEIAKKEVEAKQMRNWSNKPQRKSGLMWMLIKK